MERFGWGNSSLWEIFIILGNRIGYLNLWLNHTDKVSKYNLNSVYFFVHFFTFV